MDLGPAREFAANSHAKGKLQSATVTGLTGLRKHQGSVTNDSATRCALKEIPDVVGLLETAKQLPAVSYPNFSMVKSPSMLRWSTLDNLQEKKTHFT